MTENQVGFGKARDFRVIRPVAKATTTAVKQKYNRELLLRRDGSGKHYAVLHFTAKGRAVKHYVAHHHVRTE
jgi:hypothetical protein